MLASIQLVLKKQARMLPPLRRPASEMLKGTCQLLCQVACWLREATPGRRYARPTVRCLPKHDSHSRPPATFRRLSLPHQDDLGNVLPSRSTPPLWEAAVEVTPLRSFVVSHAARAAHLHFWCLSAAAHRSGAVAKLAANSSLCSPIPTVLYQCTSLPHLSTVSDMVSTPLDEGGRMLHAGAC